MRLDEVGESTFPSTVIGSVGSRKLLVRRLWSGLPVVSVGVNADNPDTSPCRTKEEVDSLMG